MNTVELFLNTATYFQNRFFDCTPDYPPPRYNSSMHTKLVLPSSAAIEEATVLLQQNEVVAFPTETVYGLGACAHSGTAVQKIFTAKGRPADNPLIVHISGWDMVPRVVREWNPIAESLARAFWPGPLTLILPKHPQICREASAGLDTIGIRWPDHPVAQALLRAVGAPLAAPSANRSGNPSPTTAKHVLDDLNGLIPLILDGGDCTVGVESTVVDLTQGDPVLLRPGKITVAELADVCGCSVLIAGRHTQSPKSPGMKYRHYAPKTPIQIVSSTSLLEKSRTSHSLVLAHPDEAAALNARPLTSKTLYFLLREADSVHADTILVVESDKLRTDAGLWDRLTRAAEHESSETTP